MELKEFEALKNKNYKLDMSRGKPDKKQLDLSNGLLTCLEENNFIYNNSIDCRSYGETFGLEGMKNIFQQMLEIDTSNIIIGGNSSLSLMYDTISLFMTHGVRGNTPWIKQDKIKFLCPVPGYDRHFAITEYFGIELVNIPMNNEGPDMEMIEKLVSTDSTIKGIWCVPKYSNPEGTTFSDVVVKKFANLNPCAKDFIIMWDNAYCIHKIQKEDVSLLNIFDECKKSGNEDLVYIFTSLSKITFSGGSVSCLASSDNNLKQFKEHMQRQTIGHDKINQLRHIEFFTKITNLYDHMEKHRQILYPKFDLVMKTFENELSELRTCRWSNPKGGYFLSFYAKKGYAKKIVELCKECGLTLTDYGSAYPYKNDLDNSHIRIAPTFLSIEDLKLSLEIFCLCVKIAIR